jgi:Protein of unknown function (DUF3574)
VKRPAAILPREKGGRYASNIYQPFVWCDVHIGAVGGGFCGRDARSLDARIRLLTGAGSLITTRRIVRGIRLCFLCLLFAVAAETGLRAQTQAESQGSCHGSQHFRQVAELLFGRDIGQRPGVSESAFARFVAHEITPRFPDGLTVSNATGQWRDLESGAMVREPSKRVEIVLPGKADDETRLDAVVAAYKRDFHQQSVVVIVRPACVSY